MKRLLLAIPLLLCSFAAGAGSSSATLGVRLRVLRAPEEMQRMQASQSRMASELARHCRRGADRSLSARWVASAAADDAAMVRMQCEGNETAAMPTVRIEF